MGRRDFLVKAGLVAGGLLLTVSAGPALAAAFDDLTVPIGPDSPLAKVGGFQIVDSTAGKIIIIHEDASKFVALSAKCTHKGATVGYHSDSKQIVCEKHGSRFDPDTGKVIKGPAEEPLTSYTTNPAGPNLTVKVG